MGRDERQRQKARQRKVAKEKQKQKRRNQLVGGGGPSSPRAIIRSAAQWPLHECLVSQGWDQEGEIVQILVARRAPTGVIVAGAFLVDLGCLGVKSAFANVFRTPADYELLRQDLMANQSLKPADLDLAAKIVREGLAYARKLGFSPDPDYREAAVLLTGADPDACHAQIPLGKDGMPFFVAGPDDDVPKIVDQLTRAVGEGNFEFVMPIPNPGFGAFFR